MSFAHEVLVSCEDEVIGGWTDVEIATTMIDPCGRFTLTRAFDVGAWDRLQRDARIRVLIDGSLQLDGYVDRRQKTTDRTSGSMLTITGRDKVGRIFQESAPAIRYDGLEMSEAIRRLADPWFTRITLSDARDRRLRRGKNTHKVPSGKEPIIVRASSRGGGRVEPGETRWSVIEKILEQAGLICWSSADGKELFVGRPNHDQAPQYLIAFGRADLTSLVYDEDNSDRFSLIAVVGTGGGTEQDFGIAVSSRRAVVFDSGEDSGFDGTGTGRDFLYPKRLLMPEREFTSVDEASRIAGAEQTRRDFHRTKVSATMAGFGQAWGPGKPTLYAYNTVATVRDDEIGLDDDYMIYGLTFRRARDSGDTTQLELVPRGTEIIT